MQSKWENIWRELRDAEVKVPDHLWKNIKGEIRFANSINALKNAQATPQSSVWNTIKYKLLLHNFLTFSYSTFNIYYLAAILLIITSLLWHPFVGTTNKNTQSHKIAAVKETAMPHSSTTLKGKPHTPPHRETKPGHPVLKKNSISEKVNTPPNTLPGNNSFAAGKSSTREQTVTSASNTTTNRPESNTLQITKSGTIIPVDTFIVYDTIRYYDTIKVLQPHHFEPNTFNHGFVGFCSSGGFLWSKTEPASKAFADLTNKNQSALKSQGSYSVMLEAGLKLNKRFSVISGIGFSQYFESFEYTQQENEIDTSYSYKYFNTTQYVYTQHNYIKYDTVACTYSLVMGADSSIDTVWRYNIDTVIFSIADSTAITVKDSDAVMTIDTNTYTYFYNYINRYSYVQIPLYLSYSYDLNKSITLDLKGGIVTHILINAKGYGIHFSDTYEVVDVNKLPFLKLFFNFYGAAGLTYHLDSRYSLCADIYYTTSGNIFDKDYFMKKNFYGAGIKLGFKYGF